jgi:chemotaxis protein methyltransferase CheR
MNQVAFDTLASLLKSQSGLVIGRDKMYLLETRLAPIITREKLGNLEGLATKLRGAPNTPLARTVVEAMTTNESFFFRDEKPFTHFRNVVLPALHAARPPGTKLRIWSAAASSGQEAYSLAMIIAECSAMLAGRPIEIIGSDIAREQLERARDGTYTQFEIQRGLPMQLLVKYFVKGSNGWRIKDNIRSMVQFQEWNLLSDLRPLGKFDVVYCRNVLIYLDQPTKTTVLEAISRQMTPDATLYLGGAETVLGLTDKLVPLHGERGAYKRAS